MSSPPHWQGRSGTRRHRRSAMDASEPGLSCCKIRWSRLCSPPCEALARGYVRQASAAYHLHDEHTLQNSMCGPSVLQSWTSQRLADRLGRASREALAETESFACRGPLRAPGPLGRLSPPSAPLTRVTLVGTTPPRRGPDEFSSVGGVAQVVPACRPWSNKLRTLPVPPDASTSAQPDRLEAKVSLRLSALPHRQRWPTGTRITSRHALALFAARTPKDVNTQSVRTLHASRLFRSCDIAWVTQPEAWCRCCSLRIHLTIGAAITGQARRSTARGRRRTLGAQ